MILCSLNKSTHFFTHLIFCHLNHILEYGHLPTSDQKFFWKKSSFSDKLTQSLTKRPVTESLYNKAVYQERINVSKKTLWRVIFWELAKLFVAAISQCSYMWPTGSTTY